MNDASKVFVKCQGCGDIFPPDANTKRPWVCRICRAQNTNLKVHFKILGIFLVVGLIDTIISHIIWIAIQTSHEFIDVIFGAAHSTLLVTTIILIFKSPSPWLNRRTISLIWSVFASAFFLNILWFFVTPYYSIDWILWAKMRLPNIVLFFQFFVYFIWLTKRAKELNPQIDKAKVQKSLYISVCVILLSVVLVDHFLTPRFLVLVKEMGGGIPDWTRYFLICWDCGIFAMLSYTFLLILILKETIVSNAKNRFIINFVSVLICGPLVFLIFILTVILPLISEASRG